MPKNRLIPPPVPKALEEQLAQEVPDRTKSLSEKEWKFVWEWASGDGEVSLREAALRAGYKPSVALSAARRLTDPSLRPDVVAALQQVREDLRKKYGTTFERHMKDLMQLRDAAAQARQFSAAIGAEHRRGQALGTIYIDRKEIRIGSIDSMSKDEVMRRLEELKAALEVRNLAEPKPAGDVIDVDVVQSDKTEAEGSEAEGSEAEGSEAEGSDGGEKDEGEKDEGGQGEETIRERMRNVYLTRSHLFYSPQKKA